MNQYPMTPRDFQWIREHRQQVWLTTLQYIFFVLTVACIIAGVWNLSYWVQIAVTAVLLLFAGGACKSGRS